MQEPLKILLPKFIQDLNDKNRSPSTILAYRADLEQLTVFLQKRSKVVSDDVRHEDIEAFRDALLQQKYTPKSASRKLNAVKTFFRWLMSEGLGNFDPSKDVSHPQIDSSSPKFLSPLEYRALRDIVKTDNRIPGDDEPEDEGTSDKKHLK